MHLPLMTTFQFHIVAQGSHARLHNTWLPLLCIRPVVLHPHSVTLSKHSWCEIVGYPLGLPSAPAIWQKAMSVMLQGCQGTICYINDILVTGKTRSEHKENLRQVFRRLQQYGLRVKLSKCEFFQDELKFLGHTISREGVRPTKERVDKRWSSSHS